MGASPLMSLGLKAMTASYSAMQATGHNIANAGVAGYSRQQAEFATAKGQFTGAGFFGKGVDVKTVSRAHDEFVTRAAATAKSLASADATQQERLQQLQQVFPTGESGVGYTVSNFLNSLVDLASRPGDLATRQVVLARSQDLATRFNSAASQIDTIQANVTADLRTSAATANGLTKAIAQVNDQVAAARGLGQAPNDLLDERERLISQLADLVQVSTVEADDGTVSVFIAGGQRLVLGNQAAELVVKLDPEDASRAALGLKESGVVRVVEEATLGGGSIAALLEFQNKDLVDGRNFLGQLALAVGGAVNAQQMLGMNMQQPLGTVPTSPVFSLGAPRAVPNANNAKDATTGAYISSVSLDIVDPTAVQAADYELIADPAGSGMFQVTRRSQPEVVTLINSGDVVDGVRITVGSPPPTNTDRFLLQPVNSTAGDISLRLQDPLELAAASPLVATTAAANTGTAQVASLLMLTAPPEPAASAQIVFTSDSGDYTWTLYDSSNNVISSGVDQWVADGAIPTAPNDINGFQLKLSGVPRNGDVLDIQPTSASTLSANNGNALSMAALRDKTIVGRVTLGTGEKVSGSTATDAYATALSDIGVRVQTATAAATISGAVADQAEASRTEASGVNLDEEAARLIQFQQSYQAAAKVLQIAQSVFQTLLETAAS